MLAQVTLTVVGGAKDGSTIIIPDEGTCLIGRALDCDLRLSREDGYHGVHPHHCMVEVELPVVRVHELYRSPELVMAGHREGIGSYADSREPLYPETYEVNAGEEIRIGNAVLQVGILIVTEDCPPSMVL